MKAEHDMTRSRSEDASQVILPSYLVGRQLYHHGSAPQLKFDGQVLRITAGNISDCLFRGFTPGFLGFGIIWPVVVADIEGVEIATTLTECSTSSNPNVNDFRQKIRNKTFCLILRGSLWTVKLLVIDHGWMDAGGVIDGLKFAGGR